MAVVWRCGRFIHSIDIVGARATKYGTETVSGEIQIDVDDVWLQRAIARIYKQADEAAYHVLIERKEPKAHR